MPLYATTRVTIPQISVPTYVFGSSTSTLPTSPIILDPELPDTRFLSLNSYRHWSQCLARGLRNEGLQTSDRVLFISGNSIAWPIVFMGTLMAGGVLTGVSTAMPLDYLVRLAGSLEPALILASPDGLTNAMETAKALNIAESKVFLFERECLFNSSSSDASLSTKSRHWRDLLVTNANVFDWSPYISSPDQLAVINYTSGSTGFSKGVMVSHANIIANAVQYMEQQKDDLQGPEHGHLSTWVMWAPFYHVIGQNQYCVIAPKRGIRNHIMEKLDLELLLKYTEIYRPSTMLLMPPLMIAMLSHPAVIAKKYDLSCVRNVSVGGAPLRLPLVERFESFMPNPDCRVIQGWGMTEITCVVANRHPSDRSTSCCIGTLLPNVEAKVMTPDGIDEIVGPYRSGEVWIRSPNVTKGYWRDPERTSAMYHPDGWLRTGDLGYYDEQERFYISDRIQDIVYPASTADPDVYVLPSDLESMLFGIAGVVDVGVASINADGAADQPRGFIVLDESSNATIESVMRSFEAKAQPHERLTGGLHVIKGIPKLPTGKVNRAALREMKF